jgi:hypothetical protein
MEEMMSGPKVLIVCVGKQDPLNLDNEPGPVLSFITYLNDVPSLQKYRPERVYLLYTADKPHAPQTTQKNAEQTRDRLQEGRTPVYLKGLDVSDPTDYAQLIPAMRGALDSIKSESQEDDSETQYLVNVSPGTGQMEAVWLSFVNAGVLKATLLQVKAPRTEPDVAKRVREIDIVPLFESDLIRVSSDLFRHYLFQRAEQVLLDLGARTPNDERLEAADVFADLAALYSCWQGFRYEEAFERINRLLTKTSLRKSRFAKITAVAQAQRDCLSSLVAGDLLPSVVDVYQSARRRVVVSDYVEAIWRFWASYEILVTELARKAIRDACRLPNDFYLPYRLRSFGVTCQGQPEVKRLEQRFGQIQTWPKYLDRTAAEDFLRRTRHPDWPNISEAGDDIEWLAEKRHRSVHEVDPPSQSDCERAEVILRGLIEKTLQASEPINDHPFSPRVMKQIEEQMAELL